MLTEILAFDDIRIFELYSAYDKPIRTFSLADEILAEFAVPHLDGRLRSSIQLNLWVEGSGPKPQIDHVALNPEKCGGHSWRERSGSVGFVQFYLEQLGEGRLNYSQTNTVTEARMGAENGFYQGHDGTEWNIRLTNRFSSKLNRMIRKKAVAKIGAVSILPGAAALWNEGVSFGYHWSKAKTAGSYTALG